VEFELSSAARQADSVTYDRQLSPQLSEIKLLVHVYPLHRLTERFNENRLRTSRTYFHDNSRV